MIVMFYAAFSHNSFIHLSLEVYIKFYVQVSLKPIKNLHSDNGISLILYLHGDVQFPLYQLHEPLLKYYTSCCTLNISYLKYVSDEG